MLTPNRFMNLEYSLLNVTGQVIACLLERYQANLIDLFKYARHSSDQIEESDILLAVTFLYSTGKVLVDTETGIISLVKNNA